MNRQDAIQNAKGLGSGFYERQRKAEEKKVRDRKREDDAAAWAAGLTDEELTAWWANEVATRNTNPSAKLFAQRSAAIREMRARDLYR